jgi:hypothetical protein
MFSYISRFGNLGFFRFGRVITNQGSFRTLKEDLVGLKIASLSCNSINEPEEPIIWNGTLLLSPTPNPC